MASKRDFKKEINNMIEHFINECYTQLAFSPISNQENIIDIISDTLELKHITISKINKKHYDDSKIDKKKYFSGIADEFYKQIIELTERLNSLEY